MRELRRFFLNGQNWVALLVVGFFVFLAVAAPLLAPPDDVDNPSMFKPVGRHTDHTPHPPSDQAILGTLPRQLDVFYTLVWGSRQALRFGLVVSMSTALLGVLIGALSGYLGGPVNGLTLRITDAFLAIPVVAGVGVFRQLLVVAEYFTVSPLMTTTLRLLGSDPVMLGLIFFSWMPYARIINVSVMRLMRADYVTAAKSLGARGMRIILRHLIPNVIAPAIVLIARDIGAIVILQVTFTFIGIGQGSAWGAMVVIGRNYVIGPYGDPLASWWVYLPVTVMLILFGIGWNLFGDGLNNFLNPQAAQRRSR